MASQQILFAETIAGMKKAFKRKAYESDSDSEIMCFTNRGHKLQKRARFARKGQLAPTTGPSAYKQTVDYAGMQRNVLHRNPPLVDDEGYEILSDDDDQRVGDAELAAAELNPYSNIRLENILAPLTASTDLPSHPTLSKPFTSKTLTELIAQSCSIMHKENRSLWQVRYLWTSLCGDGIWMPCETMIGPNDLDLYSEHHVARFAPDAPQNGHATPTPMVNGNSRPPPAKDSTAEPRGLKRGTTTDASAAAVDASGPKDDDGDDGHVEQEMASKKWKQTQDRDGDGTPSRGTGSAHANGVSGTAAQQGEKAEPAKGNTASEQLLTTSRSQDEFLIHPMFIPPAGAKPDRDMGIPENEAEDVRRLLALYVQKQEEVCRGASRLHQGLLRAQRLRSEVLHWSKAEAHCGPNRDLSDGEDWYDKEEWGLTEDLKKGQDEEEEDTTTTGKKTRARRA
ncbi:uncharacterized protein UV8b_05350 [Ustilaginoidea virens]|uniref:Transcriptional regulatory protein RXT2 N-terminal domain-containing protein n=1 Tax=Ustilaginoidea virens TaxID=1159556 RepID=A0A1B5KUH0_USTVR|nr:uncharacterized protein UV8b_05350 [Ustilaginoidea virens]QUC21107.1 hypothetical protein UV8b_05350 [Ustilaginoidea virens]GAO14584.1 hypothetical protein UVI_02009610 [Ustilaginoidea virens]